MFLLQIQFQNNGFLTPEECDKMNKAHKLLNMDVHINFEDTKSNPEMKTFMRVNVDWKIYGVNLDSVLV